MAELSTESINIFNEVLMDFQKVHLPINDTEIPVSNLFVNDEKIFNNNEIRDFNSLDFDSLSTKQELQNKNFLFDTVDILKKFIEIQPLAKEKNKETSCDFNILRLLKIGETMHSNILANLLNPNSEHGQESLFLYSFLNKIGIENPKAGKWIISTEKGRIDILLRRESPHSVVIIENKSNLAVDQNNQLYRYWFHQIHNHRIKDHEKYTQNHPEKYKIIYLVPREGKQPTSSSLSKPINFLEELPNYMPITPIIWRFDKEVSEWLESTLKIVPVNNHRIKEFINQYIDFWN